MLGLLSPTAQHSLPFRGELWGVAVKDYFDVFEVFFTIEDY